MRYSASIRKEGYASFDSDPLTHSKHLLNLPAVGNDLYTDLSDTLEYVLTFDSYLPMLGGTLNDLNFTEVSSFLY